jgi:uncharacterized protein (DUF2252 family)
MSRSVDEPPAGEPRVRKADTLAPPWPSNGVDRPRRAPVSERIAAGRALRDLTPRAEHARWKRQQRQIDPIQLLRASDEGRVPELVPIRYGRMLASPFAFYRGSAGLMAADLAATPTSGIRVQACGDCHLLNFGGFATPERNILFDINDFDETLPAPWEWDIKRLAASFVLAARALGLSDTEAQETAVTCARTYRKRLRAYSEQPTLKIWYTYITVEAILARTPRDVGARLQRRFEKAAKRSGSELDFPKLTSMVADKVAIRDAPPLIFHPAGSQEPGFRPRVKRVLASYRQTLLDERRVLFDDYEYVDAAMKVVGVGSVGRRCWIVLLMTASKDPLFLQFKQAVASVLEPAAGPSVYPHHGQRVVMGQRLIQPASDLFLGWVTDEESGNEYYVRQLRDAKIKPLIETFDYETLHHYARMCGWVLARAHAKGGDGASIAGYLGASDTFDEAMGDFGLAYADQAERDHAALKAAVRKGEMSAYTEV